MISLIEQQDFFVGRRRAFGKDGCNLFFGLSDPFGEDVTACLDNELPAKVMGQKMRQIGFPCPWDTMKAHPHGWGRLKALQDPLKWWPVSQVEIFGPECRILY